MDLTVLTVLPPPSRVEPVGRQIFCNASGMVSSHDLTWCHMCSSLRQPRWHRDRRWQNTRENFSDIERNWSWNMLFLSLPDSQFVFNSWNLNCKTWQNASLRRFVTSPSLTNLLCFWWKWGDVANLNASKQVLEITQLSWYKETFLLYTNIQPKKSFHQMCAGIYAIELR